jgi:alpha-ketoglutarate-dependent 2,4-dichlorophenoxyacetate dioxygenase
MTLQLTPLHPLFAAEVSGVDASYPLADKTIAEIQAAIDRYAGLVFHDQALDDDANQ